MFLTDSLAHLAVALSLLNYFSSLPGLCQLHLLLVILFELTNHLTTSFTQNNHFIISVISVGQEFRREEVLLGITHVVMDKTLAGAGRRAEGSCGLAGGLFVVYLGRSLETRKSIACLSCKGSMAKPQK